MKFTIAILSLALASANGQTYKPGDFSAGNTITYNDHKLFLSNGLKGRVLAHADEPITSDLGVELASSHHAGNDGGGTIPHKSGDGGYFYVSNSEVGAYPENYDPTQPRETYAADLIGGAYAFEFNFNHELIGYRQLLENTALNCHGGVTPWNTWISCEEHRQWGRCWQVDPHGDIEPKPTSITGDLRIPNYGNWEAFAWDGEYAYVTDDDKPEPESHSFKGALVRYTPGPDAKTCLEAGDDAGKWCTLESGTLEYLKLNPAAGTFEWVANIEESNPDLYRGSEGIDITDGILTFVTVFDKLLFRLNLADKTYTSKSLPFPQEPDNIRVLGDTLYLCTDGDHENGDAVWGWDPKGAYKIIYEENHNYPAGVSFSPDGTRMYVSFWGEATWQFWREDGLAFNDGTAGAVYETNIGLDGTDPTVDEKGAGRA